MPASKFKLERKCEICGNTFLAKTISSKYCSRHCGEVASRQKKKEAKKEQQRQELAAKIPQERLYISIAEAVALFGISRDTIYRLIRKGKLPAANLCERLTHISRQYIEAMFPKSDTQQVVEKNDVPAVLSFDPKDCYTIGEISKKFGISESTVYKYIRKSSIPTRPIGKFVYAPKSEIDKIYK